MEKLRISLLTVILSSVFLIFGRISLAPIVSNSKITPFVFPTTIPLPGWQPMDSRPMSDSIASSTKYLAARHYQYIQNDLPLDIEMRYLVNTGGNVRYLINYYSSIPPSSGQLSLSRMHKGIGFYILFAHQQRAYLSSCINSRGGSTVTASQFTQNQYIYDMRLERLLPWLLGQGSIGDKRCLWAHLSTPLKTSAPEDAYRVLETAWFSWYQWWHPRFPKP